MMLIKVTRNYYLGVFIFVKNFVNNPLQVSVDFICLLLDVRGEISSDYMYLDSLVIKNCPYDVFHWLNFLKVLVFYVLPTASSSTEFCLERFTSTDVEFGCEMCLNKWNNFNVLTYLFKFRKNSVSFKLTLDASGIPVGDADARYSSDRSGFLVI